MPKFIVSICCLNLAACRGVLLRSSSQVADVYGAQDENYEQDLKRKLKAAKELGACSCLNWMDLYNKGLTCGAGAELTDVEGLDFELCRDNPEIPNSAFFPKQNHSFCVNLRKSTPSTASMKFGGHWCYVSSECMALNGGRKVEPFFAKNQHLSWKKCGEQDQTLAEFWPEKLWAINNFLHSDHQVMAQMAYPWNGTKSGPPATPSERNTGVIGGSLMHDTFAVLWNSQEWILNEQVECVAGCKPPMSKADSAALAALIKSGKLHDF